MVTVVGVRLKRAGKIYSYKPGTLEIEIGDKVIVETARGMECGTVVIGPREVDEAELEEPLKVVHRLANASDLERVEENKQKAKDAFAIGKKKIAEHGLEMKLVGVEYTFDMSKIIFYFTADGRVDFRELVKDLASVFRTRIELRQIGVRDEAKIVGGIGCCGRPLCCASFLEEFVPVSIHMAKEQNLSLNPTKISGICGRLMCCLKYESGCYCNGGGSCPQKKKVQEPEQGSRVGTSGGDGKVIAVNAQRHTATILLDNNQTVVEGWDSLQEPSAAEAPTAEESTAAENRRHRAPADKERKERRERKEHNGKRREPRAHKERRPRKPHENGGREEEHRNAKRRPRREGRSGHERKDRRNASSHRGSRRQNTAPDSTREDRD